jgi:hypothetical protein
MSCASFTSFRIPTTNRSDRHALSPPRGARDTTHVVVTFPIHGISGFPDHIVTHSAVTRVYLELQGPEHPWLQRLAFFTVVSAPAEFPWHVNVTAPAEIDCAFQVTASDMERFHKALETTEEGPKPPCCRAQGERDRQKG